MGLVVGLVEGNIPAHRWRDCVRSFPHGASALQLAALDDATGSADRALVRRADFETKQELQKRVRA